MYKLLVQIKAVYICICTSYWYIQVTGTYRIWNSFGTKPKNNYQHPWHDLGLPVSPFPHLLHPPWRSLLSDHLAIFSYVAGTKIQAHYIFSKNLCVFPFCLLCMTSFNLCVVNTFFVLCYISQEFIKTKHYSPCLYDSKHFE